MSKEEKNKVVPKLRFTTFKDNREWDKKTLFDLAINGFSNGVFNDPKKVGFGYKLINVIDMYLDIPIDENKLSLVDISVTEFLKNKVEFGDIFFTRSSLVAAGIAQSNIYLGTSNDVTFDGHLIKLRPNTSIVKPLFLHYSLKTEKVRSQLIAKGKTATMTTIGQSDIAGIGLSIPFHPEQQKIADCLSSLDELITAQNQKLEALKAHKKGLMQQLFPAEGQTVPQLRFAEFRDSGEWEEKTLAEISTAIFDGTHQTPSYTESGIPFFSVENLVSGNKNKFISRKDYLTATIKNKPEEGDILITRIGKIGYSKVVYWNYEFSIYVTLAVVKQSEQFNSYYLHSYIQSSKYQTEIMSKSLLNAVPCKINMDEFRKTKVFLPPDKEKKEQQKIADCFSSLDELITAHAEKIEALKAHKKGMMQGLFPSVNESNS